MSDDLKAAAELYKKHPAETGIDSKAEFDRFADARERLAQWAVDNMDTERYRLALSRIEEEAIALGAEKCPPSPHGCSKCEILFLVREALGGE